MTGWPNIRMILPAIDLKSNSATIFSKIATGDFRFDASQSSSAGVVFQHQLKRERPTCDERINCSSSGMYCTIKEH
jgi:hypothetical protein